MTTRPVLIPKGVRRLAAARRDRRDIPGTLVFRGAHGFAVMMPRDIHDRLVRFASDGSGLEWMGLLAGQLCEDGEGEYVRLTGVMPHTEADRAVSSVRVSAEAARAVRRETERYFPDSHLVGWVHSHPQGATARFSSTDREYQRNWPESWSIGIVVEPTDGAVLRVYRGPHAELLAPSAPLALDARPHAPGARAGVAPCIAALARVESSRWKAWGWTGFAVFASTALVAASSALLPVAQGLRAEMLASRRALERSAASSERLARVAERLARANTPAIQSPSIISGPPGDVASQHSPPSLLEATDVMEKAPSTPATSRDAAPRATPRAPAPGSASR